MIRGSHGFTLIEVMVALAVIAIAMAALIMATGHAADDALYLQRRTLATWIAADRLAELRLRRLSPGPGSRDSGERELAGVRWQWRQAAQPSPDPAFVQVIVSVGPADRPQRSDARLLALFPRSGAQR